MSKDKKNTSTVNKVPEQETSILIVLEMMFNILDRKSKPYIVGS